MTRKLERKEINQTIRAHDIINGGNLGELVNITTQGMMLMTEKDIQANSIFQLELGLPTEIRGSSTLMAGVDCLWCKPIENSHLYWAGFHIIDISTTGLEQIETLITNYSN